MNLVDFAMIAVASLALLALRFLIIEQRKDRAELDRNAWIAAKYPPLTPEQQRIADAGMKDWEREQYIKEGGH